jgi:hypothetical protein
MMKMGKIFSAIPRDEDRKEISKGLKQVRGRILSFHIFHQDAYYMHQCAEALRLLLPVHCDMSIREQLNEIFVGGRMDKCEVAEFTFVQYEHRSKDDAQAVALCQLYLYAMRHLPSLRGIAPRMAGRKSGATKPVVSEIHIGYLAQLAFEVGFDSPEIRRRLAKTSPSIEIYKTRDAGLEVQLTSDSPSLPLRKRSGRPFDDTYESDRNYLFLPILLKGNQVHVKKNMTSFAIQRDIFLAFFRDFREIFSNLEPTIDPETQKWEDFHVYPEVVAQGENSVDWDHSETVIQRLREPSSIYSRNISTSLTASNSHSAGGDTISVQSFIDSYNLNKNELAPGFETIPLSMETFHTLDATHTDEIQRAVATFQASREKPIVLFDLESKSYAKFSASATGQRSLMNIVTDQSRRQHCYFTFPHNGQCVTWRRHRLLEAVQSSKLVLTAEKRKIYRDKHRELIWAKVVEHVAFESQ